MIARRAVVMVGAVLPLTVAAQTRTRVYRIEYLTGGEIGSRREWLAALLEGLAQHGYRRGENLEFNATGVDGRFERLADVAAELVRRAPDVLVVSTSPGVRAAMAATNRIPIVTLGPDPFVMGIVRNLARPEGNVTGISNATTELAGKRLEILKELVPQAGRIAALVNPDDPNAEAQIANARDAARRLGVELAPVLALRAPGDVEGVLAAAVAAGAAAAIRMVDPLTSMIRPALQLAAARHRLPVIYLFRGDVEAGGLIAYGANQAAIYRQGARLVHRVLQGAAPAELPFELPTLYELVISRRAARDLGLEIPATLAARADEVIE